MNSNHPAVKTQVRWRSIARWIIALLVAIGLVVATTKAIGQWREQIQQLESELRSVDRQIDEFQAESPMTMSSNDASLESLRKRRSDLRRSLPRWSNLNWPRMGLAGAIYAIGLLPPAWLLRRAAITMRQSAPLRFFIAAQVLGHAGKYVPGKAMVVVLRVGALRRAGVATVAATVAVFIETLLMMAVGGCFAGVILFFLPVPEWLRYSALLVAIVAGLPTLPPVLGRVVAKVVGRNKEPRTVDEGETGGPAEINLIERGGAGHLFVAGWAYSLMAWVAIAGSFALMVSALPLPATGVGTASVMMGEGQLTLACAAAISLAMVIGFASLLPGGAGIRELVLTTVLSPVIGTPHALLAAIAVRLLFLVVECLLAAIAWALLKTSKTEND